MIPDKYKKLFWEYDLNNISIINHSKLIIERIIEKGNFDSLKWLINQYNINNILEVCNNSKSISYKTKLFWNKIAEVN